VSKIVFNDPTKLLETIRFAREVNCAERLGLDLLRLIECLGVGMTKDNQRTAEVYPDFAPYSLSWCIWSNETRERQNVVLNGGWIYDGPGCPSDGSFPALTVSLGRLTGSDHPSHSWGIHT
jgi:hypothetical protein